MLIATTPKDARAEDIFRRAQVTLVIGTASNGPQMRFDGLMPVLARKSGNPPGHVVGCRRSWRMQRAAISVATRHAG